MFTDMLTDLHSGAAQGESAAVPVDVVPVPPEAPDPRANAEFRTLLNTCGVSQLDTRGKIFITGQDRTRWLNGMVTNNVRDLPKDHGLYAFLLNAQGRIQGDLYAFHLGDKIVLDIESAQAPRLTALFDQYIVMDDVVLEDATAHLAAVGIQGPKAKATLEAAAVTVPELAPLQLVSLTWRGFEITLVRSEAWKGDAFEIWLAPEHATTLMQALQQAGAAPVGAPALRLYRMAAGIPQFGIDIRERDLPQETAQDRALHFAKGCYVGQEIVERIRSRGQVHRVFSGFELTAPAAPGDKIEAEVKAQSKEAESKAVGEITSIASFSGPQQTRTIALGYLRREAFGKPLTIHGATLRRHELPFQELLQP